jgi:hypothetical protein
MPDDRIVGTRLDGIPCLWCRSIAATRTTIRLLYGLSSGQQFATTLVGAGVRNKR